MKSQISPVFGRQMLGALFISGALVGCSTTPNTHADKNDPWEGWNRGANEFNKDFDDTILKPLAKGYQNTVPNPVDKSITNVFSNINDIGVTINDFLQFKFIQGGMDASRFVINSTVGLVGIFDVAKEIDLPKHDEDFGQTLGYWGVPSGSYLVLPFLGASSPRDTFGLIGDALLNPLTYVSLFGGVAANVATTGATIVDVTDTRSDLMSSEKIIDEASVDRYDFIKNAYQQRREFLIYDGNPPEKDNDPLSDEGNGGNSNGDSTSGNTQNDLVKTPSTIAPATHDTSPVPVINNSTTLPRKSAPNEAPVIDNSKHLLDLSAPE
jgi:phospholipid-binding lipoprotein MlaA